MTFELSMRLSSRSRREKIPGRLRRRTAPSPDILSGSSQDRPWSRAARSRQSYIAARASALRRGHETPNGKALACSRDKIGLAGAGKIVAPGAAISRQCIKTDQERATSRAADSIA